MHGNVGDRCVWAEGIEAERNPDETGRRAGCAQGKEQIPHPSVARLNRPAWEEGGDLGEHDRWRNGVWRSSGGV